jgi:HlyD family secretion protein
MATPRWCIAASVLLTVAGTTAGVVSLAGRVNAPLPPQSDPNAKGGRKIDSPFFEVKPGRLDVTVDEMGLLEATRHHDVFCQVEGQITIISIVPDETRVSKGQLVCELDSAALKDQLTLQYIATAGAEAATPSMVSKRAISSRKQGVSPFFLR